MTNLKPTYLLTNYTMADVRNENFKYFIDHHDEIYKEHPNQYVIIYDKQVRGSADSFEGALALALDNGLELGHFLIQECTEGDDGYTQTFHTRVVFA